MLNTILWFLSFIVIVYTIFCFIYIILSWIPGLKFTRFGKFVTKICEPYMTLFSKRGWLRFGNLDFSPIISLGILSLISSILGQINSSGKFFFGGILAAIFALLWDIVSALLMIFFFMILIRWIVLMSKHGETDYNSIWNQIDSIIGNFCRKLAGSIVRKPIKYQTSLLITWITTLLSIFILSQLFRVLEALCMRIPF